MNGKSANLLDTTLVEAWNEPEKLPEMLEWLKETRSESASSQYAYIIMKKHFARSGVELEKNEVPAYWWAFGMDLDSNIHSFVSKKEHSEMLKTMFVEIVDFCEAAFSQFFAYYLFVFIERFIDRDPPYSLFVPLLPAKALEKFGEIHEIMRRQHEEDLERQNQIGY